MAWVCPEVLASTVSAGPAAAAGWVRVTVVLPLMPLVAPEVLVAVTVTVAGAGYGVV